MEKWLSHPGITYFVILADGRAAGGIAYLDRGEGDYYLARLYVAPVFQGRGAAGRAIALSEAAFPGAKRFGLDFPVDLDVNRRLYERAGYRDTGRRERGNDRLTLAIYEKTRTQE